MPEVALCTPGAIDPSLTVAVRGPVSTRRSRLHFGRRELSSLGDTLSVHLRNLIPTPQSVFLRHLRKTEEGRRGERRQVGRQAVTHPGVDIMKPIFNLK